LGNILATITDNKIYQTNGSPAKVISGTDYYAFGAAMPSRSYQDAGYSKYRYGFNGKENDDDFQDYGMRIYKPEIGKFLSVDPLSKDYPFYTPYQFAGNKPIMAVDLDGAEEKIAIFMSSPSNKNEFNDHYTSLKANGYTIIYVTTGREILNYLTGKAISQGEQQVKHDRKNIMDLIMLSHGHPQGLTGGGLRNGIVTREGYEQNVLPGHVQAYMSNISEDELNTFLKLSQREQDKKMEPIALKNGTIQLRHLQEAYKKGQIPMAPNANISLLGCNTYVIDKVANEVKNFDWGWEGKNTLAQGMSNVFATQTIYTSAATAYDNREFGGGFRGVTSKSPLGSNFRRTDGQWYKIQNGKPTSLGAGKHFNIITKILGTQ
jgi:RHS repeat-associated protein